MPSLAQLAGLDDPRPEKHDAFEVVRCEDRAEWLQRRRETIGASEAAAILGMNPWSSALDVYADKLGLKPEEPETIHMKMGRKLEPVVCDLYTEDTDRDLFYPGPYTILRSTRFPFMGASLDRVITQQRGDRYHFPRGPYPGVLEAKAPGWYKGVEWEDEPPTMYVIQNQHQQVVAGTTWGGLAALIGTHEFKRYEILYHPEFVETVLVPKLEQFWHLVATRTEPAPDHSDSARQALLLLYPTARPATSIPLGEEAAEWHWQKQAAQDIIEEQEKIVAQATNNLRAAIRDAEKGILPNGLGAYTLKNQERAGNKCKDCDEFFTCPTCEARTGVSSTRVLRYTKK